MRGTKVTVCQAFKDTCPSARANKEGCEGAAWGVVEESLVLIDDVILFFFLIYQLIIL
jgi:hypothetical protein